MAQGDPPIGDFKKLAEGFQQSMPTTSPGGSLAAVKALKEFRKQVHFLAGIWIVIGALLAFLGFGILQVYGLSGAMSDDQVVPLIVACALGLVWLAIGMAAYAKSIGAVYLGLALSYLSLLVNFATMVVRGSLINFCGLMILVVVIVQAHRVLAFAVRVRSFCIPLTTRPEQLRMQVALPPGQFPT